jgi:formylglycine-generating enzyme required for sulfatase activity
MAAKAATQYVNFPKQLGSRKATATVPASAPKAEKSEALDLSAGGAFSLAGVTVEMARVDAATFTMGQPNPGNTFSTFSMNMPAHQVKLKAFAISKTEVTQELWQAVMGSNPSETKDAQRPVENVTWDECQIFLSRLNQLCGMKFRLPTEAEWEYAAQCSGKYAASGIRHMTDGVDEWCQDYYARYTQMNQQNPKGPSMGFQRVVRGGGNNRLNSQERVAQRGHMKANRKSPVVGLRLAHDL